MKIAILSTIEGYVWAGTEEVWYHFAKLALSEGHDVMLIADWKVSGSQQVKELLKLGLQLSIRKPFRPMKIYLFKERFFPDYRKAVGFSPDILLINSGSLQDVVFLPYLERFCKVINTRKVFFCHFVAEISPAQNNPKLVDFLLQMDKVLFVSVYNKKMAFRQLSCSLKEVEVIENCSRVALDVPLGWPSTDTYNFACVARFETLCKGQDVLLEIFSHDEWTERNWHLNFYGEGPDQFYIERLIDFYGLRDRVSIVGYVSSVDRIWKDNHAMLLPSRGEGMSLAVLEAMMCGRPVITTDVGGSFELVEHGKSGWIADAATVRSYGSILDKAWEERKQWEIMGKVAHEKAKSMNMRDPAARLLKSVMDTLTLGI